MDIDAMVRQCKRTGEGIDALIAELAVRTYDYARYHRDTEPDDAGEFLLFMFPRFESMIERFRADEGVFDHFLSATIKRQLTAYLRLRRDRQTRDELTPVLSYADEERDEGGVLVREVPRIAYRRVPPNSPIGELLKVDEDGRTHDRRVALRIQILMIRACSDLTDDDVRRLTRFFNGDEDRWSQIIREMRFRTSIDAAKLKVLRDRVRRNFADAAYYDCGAIRTKDDTLRVWYRERAEGARRRYYRALKVLRSTRCSPSHRVVSRVLGVARGTISSSVHYIRDRVDRTAVLSAGAQNNPEIRRAGTTASTVNPGRFGRSAK